MRRLVALLVFALLCSAGAAAVRPPIVDAAKNGDRDGLRSLLEKKANVNAADADGTTALHWAAYRDEVETADMLIRAGAKVNAANDTGVTALWIASQNGSEGMVRRLLVAGANPNTMLLSGETPVMVASRSGYAGIVEQLATKGANVNAKATREQTALMWAVSQKHPDVVKVLLAHGADIRARSESWSEMMAVPPHGWPEYSKLIPHGNETALLFAARVGDLDSAKLLVAAGAGVNDADAWGVSAVTLAAHSGFTDMVEFFLNKGADPNSAPAGFTALHEAIMRRDERMVTALLDRGANASAPLKTWTPTRRTSNDFNFNPELVGATPLWLAARFSEPNVIRLLLKHGADAKFVHHGEHMVEGRGGEAFQKRTDVTTTLMASLGMGGGGNPWVPVERAQREPLTLETVKLLLDLGVDMNLANTDGRTALDAARQLRYDSVIKLLTDKGAKAGTGGTGGRGQRN